MPKQKGRAVVISSVSGGGKSTLIRLLCERRPDIRVAITATTRPPRPGEVNGVHYYFYSEDRFRECLRNEEFLEHAIVHGNLYGIPRAPVISSLDAGAVVILVIDVQGFQTLRQVLKDRMISIFLLPPDREEWEARLRGRGTETEEKIRQRLEMGRRELELAGEYDFRVINDDLNRATDEVLSIIEAACACRS